jgi:type III secretory pathway lipoprotein EscJ
MKLWKKRDRDHLQKQKIGEGIAKLRLEKRKLQQELLLYKQNNLPNKKKKEMTNLFEEQIKQVEEEIEQDESKMASLLETPPCTNWTPDSAASD